MELPELEDSNCHEPKERLCMSNKDTKYFKKTQIEILYIKTIISMIKIQ